MHSFWLIISSVFFGVAGVYFFIKPELAMEMAAIYAGVAIFMSGVSQMMRHLTATAENRSGVRLLMAGFDILFGIWLLTSGNYKWLIVLMPYMFAAYILMRGGMLITFYLKTKSQIPSPLLYLYIGGSRTNSRRRRNVYHAALRHENIHLCRRHRPHLVRFYQFHRLAGKQGNGIIFHEKNSAS